MFNRLIESSYEAPTTHLGWTANLSQQQFVFHHLGEQRERARASM